MTCVCNNKMVLEDTTTNGHESPAGEIFYCEACGRLFYKDVSIGEDESYWRTPRQLTENK